MFCSFLTWISNLLKILFYGVNKRSKECRVFLNGGIKRKVTNVADSRMQKRTFYAPLTIFHVLHETKWSLHSSPSPLELVYVVDGPSKDNQVDLTIVIYKHRKWIKKT